MKRILTLLGTLTLLLTHTLSAQDFWTKKSPQMLSEKQISTTELPEQYDVYELNTTAFTAALEGAPLRGNTKNINSEVIIAFPTAHGHVHHYRVIEAPVFDAALSAQYPSIKSYAGQGIENPADVIRFSVSPLGIKSLLFSSELGTEYLEPYTADLTHYLIFNTENRKAKDAHFECKTKHTSGISIPQGQLKDNADDGILRNYRLAVSTNGEYTAHFGTGTVADALAAINATMTNINALFEKDFNVTMTVIANTTSVIYTNANTDPYTDDNGWGSEVQTTLTNVIGEANYDVGHLFAKGDGGGAVGTIGAVCIDEQKGDAYSAESTNPQGYDFDINLLAHEFGHQFGANHTWTHNGDEGENTQMEPGSGSTIMSYAGITGATDVQDLADNYFHAISIQQVTNYIKSITCQTSTATGNTVPTVSAGTDYTIPKGTPFVLTGTASDSDGDALTYCWEQMDENDAATTVPSPTATSGVAFRSRPPVTSPMRTFPEINAVLMGSTTPMWEVVPNVARTLNFRLTVRDNQAGGGTNESDNMVVTVDNTTGPFAVTQPNSVIAWPVGSTQTITWDVAGSDAAPINTTNVNILISTDGGMTFTTLVANTSNDGSETITVPDMLGDFTRIKIEAVGNIFFDISNTNFTIGDAIPQTYCAAEASDNTGEFINNVTIGSINNTSGEGAAGYEDFSMQTATLIKSESASFSIIPTWTGGVDDEGYAIWIDYNKNGDFTDTGEMVFSQSPTQMTPIAGSFVVSATAITGTTRMRIAMSYDAIPSSCGTIDFGEVEDYTVLLQEPALPLEWLDFRATVTDAKTVQLDWTTASEVNVAHFVVERSANGRDFSEILQVAANGNTTTTNRYAQEDKNPLNSQSYYRIRQIDTDGSFAFSSVKAVVLGEAHTPIKVYPNPIAAGSQLTISSALVQDLEVTILDTKGRFVATSSIANGNGTMQLHQLPVGLYLYKITSDKHTEHGRLIIK